MNSILKRLILLYPRAWRKRYQNEFEALLDDVAPTWRTLFDVFGGALKMQMKIWSSWKSVAAFVVAGTLAAVAFSFTVPDRYVSTAIIKIENGGIEGVGSIVERMESRSSLVQLINEQGLYKGERSRVPLQDVVEQMKTKDIRIIQSTKGDLPAISISFAGEDAAQARQTTDGLVHRFMGASLRSDADNPAGPAHTFALLDPPSPAVHVGPRRLRIITMGVIAGIVAGFLFALFNGLKMWKHAAVLGIAGAVLFGSASFLAPERYSSNAMLAYRPADDARVKPIIDAVLTSARAITVNFSLYPNEKRPEDKLREHLHVQQNRDSRTILIQFDYPDQRIAQRVVQNVTSQVIKENWNIEVLDAATFPQRPFSPNRAAASETGLGVGFAIAAVLGLKRGPAVQVSTI